MPDISIVETVRAIAESNHDEPGQKAHKVSKILNKFAKPIFDQCAKKDNILGLYLVTLLSEYVEDIDVTPFLCTPDLEGLSSQRVGIRIG